MYEKSRTTKSSPQDHRFFGLGPKLVNFILLVLVICLFVLVLFLGPIYIDPSTGILIVLSGILESIGRFIYDIFGINIPIFQSIPHTWPGNYEIFIWMGRYPRAIAVLFARCSESPSCRKAAALPILRRATVRAGAHGLLGREQCAVVGRPRDKAWEMSR